MGGWNELRARARVHVHELRKVELDASLLGLLADVLDGRGGDRRHPGVLLLCECRQNLQPGPVPVEGDRHRTCRRRGQPLAARWSFTILTAISTMSQSSLRRSRPETSTIRRAAGAACSGARTAPRRSRRCCCPAIACRGGSPTFGQPHDPYPGVRTPAPLRPSRRLRPRSFQRRRNQTRQRVQALHERHAAGCTGTTTIRPARPSRRNAQPTRSRSFRPAARRCAVAEPGRLTSSRARASPSSTRRRNDAGIGEQTATKHVGPLSVRRAERLKRRICRLCPFGHSFRLRRPVPSEALNSGRFTGSIPPLPLPRDVEGRRVGDGHDGHHPGLQRIGHHQIGGIGHAAGHVEADDDHAGPLQVARPPR